MQIELNNEIFGKLVWHPCDDLLKDVDEKDLEAVEKMFNDTFPVLTNSFMSLYVGALKSGPQEAGKFLAALQKALAEYAAKMLNEIFASHNQESLVDMANLSDYKP